MLEIHQIRSHPDEVAAALARRGDDGLALGEVIKLDSERLQRIHDRDAARQKINELSRQVRELRQADRVAEAESIQLESRQLGQVEQLHNHRIAELDEAIHNLLLHIPNTPSPDCPSGQTEADNPVLRTHHAARGGTSRENQSLACEEPAFREYQRVPHWEFAVEMGILDLERAAKISGAMFAMFRGAGAVLARALVSFGLDRNSDLYEEVLPPSLVRRDTMVRTGHLPKFVDDAYEIARDDLWPIPTGEVPLTSLCEDEILAEEDLPMRFMAATPCYRREAGSAGRDTRGLLRVHEFQKVEILAYATAEQAAPLHDELLERAEGAVRDLGLDYRIIDICTGDLGNSSARTFDVEVYAPGADRWLECSSVSWFGDYQARRANIRYRPSQGRGTHFVHTLNGSAVAVPRLWAAIVETYRQPGNEIAVPEVLRPYMGGLKVISVNVPPSSAT